MWGLSNEISWKEKGYGRCRLGYRGRRRDMGCMEWNIMEGDVIRHLWNGISWKRKKFGRCRLGNDGRRWGTAILDYYCVS